MSNKSFSFDKTLPASTAATAALLADINAWHSFTDVFGEIEGEPRELEEGYVVSTKFVITQAGKPRPQPWSATIEQLPDPAGDSPTLILQQAAPGGAMNIRWVFALTPEGQESSKLNITLSASGWMSWLLWAGFRTAYQDALQQFAKDAARKLG
ncbi:MAG: hypothetical protein Alpg2KO_27360 [Alphaproteobacteria bacterium]